MKERKPWICQNCNIVMNVTDMDFLKCSICETEVWFKEPDSFEAVRLAEQEAGYNDDIFLQPKKKGGSKSSGRNSRKQLLKKPTTTQLYKDLCK